MSKNGGLQTGDIILMILIMGMWDGSSVPVSFMLSIVRCKLEAQTVGTL
jgi:hypothetical protein